MGCCTCRESSLKPISLPHLLYDFLSPHCVLESSKKMNSLFDVECSLQSNLIISGCSSFLLFNDNRTESESENMMNFLCFSFEIMLRAKSIAQASALKIELSLEEVLFLSFCLRLLHMLFYYCLETICIDT